MILEGLTYGEKSYGWSGSISDFLVSEKSDWLSTLAEKK